MKETSRNCGHRLKRKSKFDFMPSQIIRTLLSKTVIFKGEECRVVSVEEDYRGYITIDNPKGVPVISLMLRLPNGGIVENVDLKNVEIKD
jgi:hypothetical protein